MNLPIPSHWAWQCDEDGDYIYPPFPFTRFCIVRRPEPPFHYIVFADGKEIAARETLETAKEAAAAWWDSQKEGLKT